MQNTSSTDQSTVSAVARTHPLFH